MSLLYADIYLEMYGTSAQLSHDTKCIIYRRGFGLSVLLHRLYNIYKQNLSYH